MKNRQFSQSTGLSWISKTFIILIGIIVVVFAVGIYLYNDILNSKTMELDETKKVIIEQTPVTQVESVELFHGDEAYHVVYGNNSKDEEMIIFYPIEGKEKNIKTIKTSEILSEEEMYQSWLAACKNCAFVDITPALIQDTILWEITYYDENNQYVLDYFSIEDGSSYEQYRFNS